MAVPSSKAATRRRQRFDTPIDARRSQIVDADSTNDHNSEYNHSGVLEKGRIGASKNSTASNHRPVLGYDDSVCVDDHRSITDYDDDGEYHDVDDTVGNNANDDGDNNDDNYHAKDVDKNRTESRR